MFWFWLFCSLICNDGGIGIDVAWHPSQAWRGQLSKVRGYRRKEHIQSFSLYRFLLIQQALFLSLKIHLYNHLYFFFFQSKDDQIQVIGNLKNISMASSKLLLAAKSLSVDPGAANAKNLLAVAARCDVTILFFFCYDADVDLSFCL